MRTYLAVKTEDQIPAISQLTGMSEERIRKLFERTSWSKLELGFHVEATPEVRTFIDKQRQSSGR